AVISVNLREAAIDRALSRYGAPKNADEFLAILTEAVDSTDILTAAEQQSLTTHGGIDPEAVDPTRQGQARRQIAVSATEADATATREGYTTGDVADMLEIAPANVRRLVKRGDLYVAG